MFYFFICDTVIELKEDEQPSKSFIYIHGDEKSQNFINILMAVQQFSSSRFNNKVSACYFGEVKFVSLQDQQYIWYLGSDDFVNEKNTSDDKLLFYFNVIYFYFGGLSILKEKCELEDLNFSNSLHSLMDSLFTINSKTTSFISNHDEIIHLKILKIMEQLSVFSQSKCFFFNYIFKSKYFFSSTDKYIKNLLFYSTDIFYMDIWKSLIKLKENTSINIMKVYLPKKTKDYFVEFSLTNLTLNKTRILEQKKYYPVNSVCALDVDGLNFVDCHLVSTDLIFYKYSTSLFYFLLDLDHYSPSNTSNLTNELKNCIDELEKKFQNFLD